MQPELFLVAVERDAVVGTVMAGYDGRRGWLSSLAAAPSHRGQGVGRRLVAEAERLLEAMGCPKVQLTVRPDNAGARGFSEALGYEPFEICATGRRLVVDGPGGPPAPA